mmetsp:Transcript_28085/g.66800  ORF Transcript_28085/g.66800 Transcript_28085/m.66800 type:complete len:81 (-) Transcript_28085:307-549(-)
MARLGGDVAQDLAGLGGDVAQDLAAAQTQGEAKVSSGKAWVQSAVDNVHSTLQQSVGALEGALAAWEKHALVELPLISTQ